MMRTFTVDEPFLLELFDVAMEARIIWGEHDDKERAGQTTGYRKGVPRRKVAQLVRTTERLQDLLAEVQADANSSKARCDGRYHAFAHATYADAQALCQYKSESTRAAFVDAFMKEACELNAQAKDKEETQQRELRNTFKELICEDLAQRPTPDASVRGGVTALTPCTTHNQLNPRRPTMSTQATNTSNPEARTKDGSAALHQAALRGDPAAVTALITAGADLEAQDKNGRTPLHSAAAAGTAETVTALLKAGANPEARADLSTTPLHLAAAGGTVETVTALIIAGANLEAQDEDGWTPLHSAAAAGTADMVTALLNAGADLEARDEGGLTPLHQAAWYGTTETVTALLNAGANLEARDKNGRTPLHQAVEGGTAETVTALVNAGADLEARNKDGGTPLHVARHLGVSKVILALADA